MGCPPYSAAMRVRASCRTPWAPRAKAGNMPCSSASSRDSSSAPSRVPSHSWVWLSQAKRFGPLRRKGRVRAEDGAGCAVRADEPDWGRPPNFTVWCLFIQHICTMLAQLQIEDSLLWQLLMRKCRGTRVEAGHTALLMSKSSKTSSSASSDSSRLPIQASARSWYADSVIVSSPAPASVLQDKSSHKPTGKRRKKLTSTSAWAGQQLKH